MHPFLYSLSILLLWAAPALEHEEKPLEGEASRAFPADSILIPADSVHPEDMTVTGDARVEGTVEGDIVLTDGKLTLTGFAEGDVVLLGGEFAIGGGIDGDLVVLGAEGRLSGSVEGDVVVFAGALDLDSTALIKGDLTVLGGELTKDTAAVVRGDETEVRLGIVGRWLERMLARKWEAERTERGVRFEHRCPLIPAGVRALVGFAVYALTYLLGLLFLVVIPGWHRRAEAVIERTFWRAILAGVVYWIAVLGAFALLVISVIGLALVPFALLGLAFMALMGTAQSSLWLGRRAARLFGFSIGSRVGLYSLGFAALYLLSVVSLVLVLAGADIPARIVRGLGMLVLFAAAILGHGGVIYVLFFRRDERPLSGEPDEVAKR